MQLYDKIIWSQYYNFFEMFEIIKVRLINRQHINILASDLESKKLTH